MYSYSPEEQRPVKNYRFIRRFAGLVLNKDGTWQRYGDWGEGRIEGTNRHAVLAAANRMVRKGAFLHRSKVLNNVRAYGFGREPDYYYSCILDRDERRRS
jgi:hypothetical protein